MHTVHYRRWSPPQSPLRVEFVPGLLREVGARAQSGQDRGTLLGLRIANEVRILAAHRPAEPRDSRLAGLSVVGVYICRARGEVFLTDADIEFMDQQQAVLALVVAGLRAGFFAREPDGTLQAVRSYEEFSVVEAAAQPPLPAPRRPPPERPLRHAAFAPQYLARWVVMLAALVGPAAALAYFRPLLPDPPLEISVREVAGQLLIGWNQEAVGRGGRLEIEEKGSRQIIELARGSVGATYAIHGADVEIRLATEKGMGSARWTTTRLAPQSAAEGPSPAETLRQQVRALEREASDLRRSIQARSAQIEELAEQARAVLAQ